MIESDTRSEAVHCVLFAPVSAELADELTITMSSGPVLRLYCAKCVSSSCIRTRSVSFSLNTSLCFRWSVSYLRSVNRKRG
jgi:hypothetical protein